MPRTLQLHFLRHAHKGCFLLATLSLGTWGAARAEAQQPQEGVVQGRVRDEEDVPLPGVLLQARRPGSEVWLRTTESDDLGYYRFEVGSFGSLEIRASRLGYAMIERRISVEAGAIVDLDLGMEPQAFELEGFSVVAERSRERARFETEAGVTSRELAGDELKMIPGIAEADPIRAAEVLPGVVSTSDFSSAFNVRGGSADQNLILLDGIPIFNPFHLGGLFSVFNADMVDRAELLAGGFPAEYSGRVSSVLDIETDPGTGDLAFDAGVSLLATRVAVGGGLRDEWNRSLGLRSSRWRVSARRSYFDVLFKPAFDLPYHLTDLQGVFEGWTPGGSRLTVTAYSGADVLSLTDVEDSSFPLKIDWSWGNDVVGVRWTAPRSDGRQVEVKAGYSRFSTDIRFPDFADTEFQSAINLFSTSLDVTGRPGRHWTSQVGLRFDRMDYDNLAVSGGTEFAAGLGEGWLLGGYAQGEWHQDDLWLVEVGSRLDWWLPEPGQARLEVAPRIAVKRFLRGGDYSVNASLGRYTQFLHSLRDEELPLGIDIWVLSGERAPTVVSNQVQVGVEAFLTEEWFVSLEGYLRKFDGVITNNLAENPNDQLDDLLPGDGQSYGADLFVRRSGEGVTGWLALSLLQAERTFPDFVTGLSPAPEITYPPIFDRRLDIDLVLRVPMRWGVDGGLRWNVGSGLPYTRAVGDFSYYSPRLTSGGRLEHQSSPSDRAIVLGPRNGARYPTYHRLDVSFRKPSQKSWGSITPYLNILNVYNQRNVLFYFYEYDRNPATRSGVSMFPLLPTIGFEVSF